jgi:hypothetical protein
MSRTRSLNGVDVGRAIADLHMCCKCCGHMILPGEAYTTIRLGPGTDPVQRERARRGEAYEPVRGPIHWACATGEEE